MAMNSMTISQAATILGSVVQQATGQSTIGNIATPEDFTAVAQTALRSGKDPIFNQLSQMWTNTVFAVREMERPVSRLRMDIPRFGNAVRKISPVSGKMINDDSFTWPVAFDSSKSDNPIGDGQSVDMWAISKQQSVQTNFYGTFVYAQRYTTFMDQLDTAFSSADEFARFNALHMTERNNDRIRYEEAVARGIQANLIGAIIDEKQEGRVIHLITDYNAETGLALTAQSIYQPDNFAPFMRWVWAKLKTTIRLMGKSSQLYQTVVSGKAILRHTSPANMRVAVYGKAYDQIETMVLSDTYNDDYLKGVTFEAIPYWQSIETPDSIAITPVYTGTDGAVKKAAAEVEQAGIFAVLHDVDALGYCFTNIVDATTPLNTRGLYWNTDVHARCKTFMDNTEKAVVMLLD